MTPHALLFTLAAIGISETVYLLRKRIAQERPVCVIGTECHKVLESKYNAILGIPFEFFGLIFYIAISLFTALIVIEIEPLQWWNTLIKLSLTAGIFWSLAFIYLQWKIIKAWCFWCLMSIFTVFAMALIVLTSDLSLIL